MTKTKLELSNAMDTILTLYHLKSPLRSRIQHPQSKLTINQTKNESNIKIRGHQCAGNARPTGHKGNESRVTEVPRHRATENAGDACYRSPILGALERSHRGAGPPVHGRCKVVGTRSYEAAGHGGATVAL